MIKTNLIIVDGICGSGKSTLAQLICLALVKKGVKAQWLYEHETPHPLCDETLMGALESGVVPLGLYRNVLSKWKTLADALHGTRKVLIVESALFQIFAGIPFLLGVKEKEIAEHIRRVETAIAKLNPQLIYIYQDNVSAAIEKVCVKRGDWFRALLVQKLAKVPGARWGGVSGFKGALRYFKDYRKVSDRIIAGMEMRTLRLNSTDGSYDRCSRCVAEFLGLPLLVLPKTRIKECADVCGSYKAAGAEDVMQISSDGKDLFLGEPGGMRLIQLGARRFVVQGMCLEITFKTRRGGCGLECRGNLPGLCLKWEKTEGVGEGTKAQRHRGERYGGEE